MVILKRKEGLNGLADRKPGEKCLGCILEQ